MTQKIVRHAVSQKIAILDSTENNFEVLRLGNLEAIRDWGHAADYCVAYQKMLEHVDSRVSRIEEGEK